MFSRNWLLLGIEFHIEKHKCGSISFLVSCIDKVNLSWNAQYRAWGELDLKTKEKYVGYALEILRKRGLVMSFVQEGREFFFHKRYANEACHLTAN